MHHPTPVCVCVYSYICYLDANYFITVLVYLQETITFHHYQQMVFYMHPYYIHTTVFNIPTVGHWIVKRKTTSDKFIA